MTNYFKEVELGRAEQQYGWHDGIMLWGSCFAKELETELYQRLYRVHSSPYGIMYNPLSIAEGLWHLLRGEQPTEAELFYHEGEWHSALHHGSYSHSDKAVALEVMQRAFAQSREPLVSGKVAMLVVTFGTSYVYEEAEAPHRVVNNCHRRPSSCFRRRRLSVAEIVATWLPLLRTLEQQTEPIRVLFTVSPVCHYRDGAHTNRLSKATLLLAIDEIIASSPATASYFPSYEIQLDELRDYRFFKEDFAHPTPQAVEHILQRFTTLYLREEPEQKEWNALRVQLQHRPLSTNRQVLQTYYQQLLNKLSAFAQKHPHPYLQQQLTHLQALAEEYQK